MPYQLPSVEVHAGEFTIVWLSNMNVKRLALVDVSTTICCHLQDSLLRDLPDSFIKLLQICRDSFNILRKYWARVHQSSIGNRYTWVDSLTFTWMEPF